MDNRCRAVFRELRSAVSVELGEKWKYQPNFGSSGRAGLNGAERRQLVAVLIHKHRAGLVPVIPGPRLFRHFRRALRESD